MNGYADQWKLADENPDAFWLEASQLVDWDIAPQTGWNKSENGWFVDGTLNTCYNAVDRHVEAGLGDQAALIYESPVTENRREYSFAELQREVAQTAGMIAAQGVAKGDRVIIYMPMVPETIFAMLACARIGAVHSVVFGGFAAPELAKRIDDAKPQLLLTASCGIEGSRIIPYKPIVDEALDTAQHKPGSIVVLQRDMQPAQLIEGRDRDWAEIFAAAEPVDCQTMRASDPLYILYTSGTTGTPKGVVRDNGGYAVALAWSMKNIYGLQKGETFWAASDVGWVVGHSYIVYGPLLAGCTAILYEGKPIGTPDAGEFWRVIERNQVSVFFTAPTAIRAIRKEDSALELMPSSGIPSLRSVFLAGERADPETINWLESGLGKPVIDHWWQTELGWPALASAIGLGDMRRKAGSAGFPVPGFRFEVLDDTGSAVEAGNSGAVVIKTPLAPGCFASLWNDKEGYAKCFASYPGYYETGDAGYQDEDGFWHIMGRTDDIINVAGHRLSTGQMEGILAEVEGVAESAVIGADDKLKGMVPIAFVVTLDGAAADDIRNRCAEHIRSVLGPIASLRQIHIVPGLPKTRSGKILRAVLRLIANGHSVKTPPTIENPQIIDEIQNICKLA